MADNKNIRIYEDENESISRKLDEKLVELHSLFELSQTLNSSLNLKAILDNLLLTPMGKMMISKGLVMLNQAPSVFKVETYKGLSADVMRMRLESDAILTEPLFTRDLDPSMKSFFTDLDIELVIPIRSNNEMLGIIGFGKKFIDKPYIKTEIDFLNSLSNIAATAIENGLMVLRLQSVNKRLDKKVQELNTLFDIGKELNSTLDPDKILNLLSYAVMGEMMINRCMVYLKENDGMKLAISKGHKDDAALEMFKKDQILANLVEIENAIDLTNDRDAAKMYSLFFDNNFNVLVPMKIKEETRGVIVVGDKIMKGSFYEDELEFLFTLGNEAMICLENARLFEETLEKQRMEEDLEIAREIQSGLLPKTCPRLQGFEIAATNIPSQQVGGDYFDCIILDDNRVCLAIADVSGKGIPASLLMANIQASLHAIIDSDQDLSSLTTKVNNIVHKNTGHDKFITFFYGILDTTDNRFTSVNAGHNPPYLYRAEKGDFQMLDTGGLLLGMLPNMPYEVESNQLHPGDWIVMFTDGISEAMNADDEEFEEHRIEAVIRENVSASAEEMKESLLSAVHAFTAGVPQSDDITVIVVKAV